MRIISTGQLRNILVGHVEDLASGVGFKYEPLPPAISTEVWLRLSAEDRACYEPDPNSVVMQPAHFPRAADGNVTVTGYYTRWILPPGSYSAWWLVNR